MTPIVDISELLLWAALLGILVVFGGISLLPQYGPMRIALNRQRVLQFAEGVGFLFVILYILTILRVIA